MEEVIPPANADEEKETESVAAAMDNVQVHFRAVLQLNGFRGS